MNDHVLGGPELTIRQKLWQIHWFFVLMLVVVAAVGFAMLYSAAGGSVDPWAKRHALRFGAGDAAFDGGGNPVHRVVDLDEAFGAVLDRQIGQIDIDRESRKVAIEEVDGRPALERKYFLLCDIRQYPDEQRHLGGIVFTRHDHVPFLQTLRAP